jgi:hypothetical protein
MRVWLFRAALVLGLLLGSAAVQRAASPPQRCELSPFAGSQRQAIVSRGSLPALALAAAGTKARRGHGPLLLAWTLPSWRGPSAPAAQRAAQLQLAQRAAPRLCRLGPGPRAPPQARPPV